MFVDSETANMMDKAEKRELYTIGIALGAWALSWFFSWPWLSVVMYVCLAYYVLNRIDMRITGVVWMIEQEIGKPIYKKSQE